MKPCIALTTGEPAGIGPDLALLLAQDPPPDCNLVAIADPELLHQRAEQLGLSIKIQVSDSHASYSDSKPGVLNVLPVLLAAPCTAGVLDPRNARYVLQTIEQAVSGCQEGVFQAMVTAPVQKSVINDAGIPFTGHTEFLAELGNTQRVVMMLA